MRDRQTGLSGLQARHPWRWAVFSFLGGSCPQWVESMWSLWSDEPLLEVLEKQPWGSTLVPEFSPFWITVPLAVVMGLLGFVSARFFRPESDDGPGLLKKERESAPAIVNGQEEYAQKLVDAGLPLNVQVTLVENKGGSPGLLVQATNLGSVAVESAAVVVTNILRWNGEKFSTSSDIHGSGVTCRVLEIGRVTLQPDEPTNVKLIHSQGHRLELNRQSKHGSEPAYRMTRAGIRQISYRVTGADGRQAEGAVCLRWDGPDNTPSPCDCPQIDTGGVKALSQGDTPGAIASKDWQDLADRFGALGNDVRADWSQFTSEGGSGRFTRNSGVWLETVSCAVDVRCYQN